MTVPVSGLEYHQKSDIHRQIIWVFSEGSLWNGQAGFAASDLSLNESIAAAPGSESPDFLKKMPNGDGYTPELPELPCRKDFPVRQYQQLM